MWFIYDRMSVRTAVTYNALYSIRTRTDPAPRTHILAYSNRADWKVQEPFPTLNPEEVAKSEEKYFTRSYMSEKVC